MRPVNFTLHAILAACLAALAASSAAAGGPVIDNEGHVWLSGAIFGSHGSSQGGHLEVHSYQWGAVPAGYELKPVRITSYQVGASGVSAGGGGNQLRTEDSAGGAEQQRHSGHSMLGASERVAVGGGQTESGKFSGRGVDIARVDGPPVNTGGGRVSGLAVDPADPASGQATGKRQHKPMVAHGYYDQAAPSPSGSLTVLASGASCRVGARYPTLTLSGRGKNYVLQDVEVADCNAAGGTDTQLTLVYRKVTVKGWNPEKKEL